MTLPTDERIEALRTMLDMAASDETQLAIVPVVHLQSQHVHDALCTVKELPTGNSEFAPVMLFVDEGLHEDMLPQADFTAGPPDGPRAEDS